MPKWSAVADACAKRGTTFSWKISDKHEHGTQHLPKWQLLHKSESSVAANVLSGDFFRISQVPFLFESRFLLETICKNPGSLRMHWLFAKSNGRKQNNRPERFQSWSVGVGKWRLPSPIFPQNEIPRLFDVWNKWLHLRYALYLSTIKMSASCTRHFLSPSFLFRPEIGKL